MRASRLPLAVLAATLLAAGPAHAADPVSTSAPDGREGTGGGARDIEQIRSDFDPGAGRWTLTVRLWEAASEAQWGMVNAHLRAAGPGGACGSGVGYLRGSTHPGSSGVSGTAGSADDGVQPDGSRGPSIATATRTLSADGRELTFVLDHPRLAGRTAACVFLTISYQNETLDSAGARFPVPAGYEPPPPPGAGPAGDAVAIRIASSRTLRVSRRNRVNVWLRAFDGPLTGNARVRRGGSGPDLARAEWRASAGKAVAVRLRLTRAGRRYVRRHRRSTGRLIVSARPTGAVVVTTFRVRLIARGR